jgi:PAS domain-containing protein
MFSQFFDYIESHEDWLMARILNYASERGYTRYTSTLKEAWRLSISGLSKSLIETVKVNGDNLELSPDDDYSADPATAFGILEAKKHRERGVQLAMFLGLMKYYHQSYQDLIREAGFDQGLQRQYLTIIDRFFDRVEIGFCTTWSLAGHPEQLEDLQLINRQMTNEKNKYLTIFESLSLPVYLITKQGFIENFNYAAAITLKGKSHPGQKYYGDDQERILFVEQFPWFKEQYESFTRSDNSQEHAESLIDTEDKHFRVSFSRSLDVSGKFSGTIVIVEDITRSKKAEKERESLINELQLALKEIKTLRGIVPICMHCKQIRDDQGYWNQLEKYITEHSEAQLSHGICEKCLEKYYGDELDG